MSEDAGEVQGTSTYQKAKRVYRVASNANRLYRFWNWLGLANMSAGNSAAAVGAAAIVASGAGLVVYDAVDHRARVAEAAPIHSSTPARAPAADHMRWADNSVVFRIAGHDQAGRAAAFDVLVLGKDFSWVRGSTSELQRAGRVLTVWEVVSEIFTPEVRDGLARASELIAVGIASQEGETATEAARSKRRAGQTAEWTFAALGGTRPIAILSLGRYKLACVSCETADTSWQRPFMLIGVRERQSGVVISEALADAMAGRSNLPSPERYSSFIYERVR